MPEDAAPSPPKPSHEPSIVETIQSLIVAFVLAMTFRGFVVEGFVIPTGSMAPTLMGAHTRVHSRQTGYEFAVGLDSGMNALSESNIVDPMLGPAYAGSAQASGGMPRRMGDRILVLKCLYPFAEPDRFDVVVFKNPTSSQGDESNYIKRLIGLPNEDVWLCDGDVFARPADRQDQGDYSAFSIQRKPEHVQRAVWQPVHDSDFVPINPQRVAEGAGRRWLGQPWTGDPAIWDFSGNNGREYRCNTDAAAQLRWDSARRDLTDWTAYNMLAPPRPETRPVLVSDVRVCATIVPDRDGLSATLELQTRSHIFEYIIQPAKAILRMKPVADPSKTVLEREEPIDLPGAGRAFTVECWHVDQSMRLFVDGREIMEPLTYDWSPLQRLQNATGMLGETDADALLNRPVQPARLRWTFEGSPLTLHRVRVDRDLHYRTGHFERGYQDQALRNPTPEGFEETAALIRRRGPIFATHPDHLGRLGPDQFMMCGDNSPMSQDSRLWGFPDPLVASQIDPTPFVVNRKLLLGKAWVVYFPAPYSLKRDSWPIIPDFGRLRFIR